MAVTESEILDLFEKAPAEIQEILGSQELIDVITGFEKTFSLHTDMVGRIAELTRNLLLGVTSPTELFGELVLTGASPEIAKKIVDELNEKIFIPVRTKMQNPSVASTSVETKPEAPPAPTIVTAPLPAMPVPQASSAPATPIVPVPSLSTAVAPAPTPPIPVPQAIPVAPIYTPPAPTPTQTPEYSVPAPAPQTAWVPPTVPVEPTMRTMAHDVEAMKSGATPAPAPYTMPAMPSAPVPQPVAPIASVPTAQPAPTPSPARPQFDPRLSAVVEAPRTPTPTHIEVASDLKKYGIDPYHEPVD